jgi:hypothetical protein
VPSDQKSIVVPFVVPGVGPVRLDSFRLVRIFWQYALQMTKKVRQAVKRYGGKLNILGI